MRSLCQPGLPIAALFFCGLCCRPNTDHPVIVDCVSAEDCDDGVYCNGQERCEDSICLPGEPPCSEASTGCAAAVCSAGERTCLMTCLSDADCDDTVFCNGTERCDGCTCMPGEPPPCPELLCISQCESDVNNCCLLGNFGCQEKPASEFDDYENMLAQWKVSILCPSEGTVAVAGRCLDGTLVLHRTEGAPPLGPSFTNFFDAQSGSLIGMRTEFGGGLLDDECQGRVDWPEPFECESPVVSEVVCGERFTVGNPLILDPCVIPCELALGLCAEHSIEAYPDYEATISEMRQRGNCFYEAPYSWLVAGLCSDGTLFIADNNGLYSETRFFDPQSRLFVSLTDTTDIAYVLHCGGLYWPVHHACEGAIVTEAICPSGYEPGDPIDLP